MKTYSLTSDVRGKRLVRVHYDARGASVGSGDGKVEVDIGTSRDLLLSSSHHIAFAATQLQPCFLELSAGLVSGWH